MHWTTADQARNAVACSRRGEFFEADIGRILYYRSLIKEVGRAKAITLTYRLKRIQIRLEAEYCITANRGD